MALVYFSIAMCFAFELQKMIDYKKYYNFDFLTNTQKKSEDFKKSEIYKSYSKYSVATLFYLLSIIVALFTIKEGMFITIAIWSIVIKDLIDTKKNKKYSFVIYFISSIIISLSLGITIVNYLFLHITDKEIFNYITSLI